MGSEVDKVRVSKRRLKDDKAVRKQVKIAKAHGLTEKDKQINDILSRLAALENK